MNKIMQTSFIVGLACCGFTVQAAEADNMPTPPVAVAQPSSDQGSEDTNKCSESSLIGDFGLQMQGVHLQGRKSIPFTAVRSANFDGQGKTSGKGMANVGGRIQTLSIDGSYKVDSDCTIIIEGTQTLGTNKPEHTTQFGVMVNGGDEILVMQNAGGKPTLGRYEKY